MEQKSFRDFLKSSIITIDNSEYSLLLQFLFFLKTVSYGDFHAAVNYNPTRRKRDIIISSTDKDKRELEPIAQNLQG